MLLKQIKVSQPITQRVPYDNGHLVGAWGFDGGKAFLDYSAGGNDASPDDLTLARKGGFEGNGSSSYASTSLAPPSSGSISAWFKPVTAFYGDIIIGRQVTDRCYLGISNTGRIGGGIGTETYNDILGTTLLDSGVWYHGVLTWDTEVVALYLDTNEEYLDIQDGDVPTGGFYLMAHNNGGSDTLWLNGEAQGIAVYDEVLTSSEIEYIFRKGIPDSSLLLSVLDGSEDLSKNRCALVNSGAVVGGRMKFNGSSDYISLNAFDSSPITNKFTAVAWINKDAGDAAWQAILSTASQAELFHLQLDTSNKLAGYVYGPSLNPLSASTILAGSGWHQVVLVYDGVDARLYIDGAQDGTTPTGTTSVTQYATSNFSIGRGHGDARFFNGEISDAKIYSEAKSADWIKLNYNRTRKFY